MTPLAAHVQDHLSGRNWLILFLTLVTIQLLPPYASKGYNLRTEWAEVAGLPIHNAIFSPVAFYPVFKLVPLALVAAFALSPQRWNWLLPAYAALNCITFALHQGIGFTPRYGLVINVADTMLFLLAA